MAKVNKNVMEQFIKGLSVDSEGNMEVPSNVMRGIFHIIIKNEIVNYLKAHYTEPIKLYSDDIKEISNNLVRNSAQVIYYLREIARDKTMDVRLISTDNSVTTRVIKKLKKYFLNRGENSPVSVYDVARAIEENVSTFYAIAPNTNCIILNSNSCGYDDRGRKARTICLSNNTWKSAKANG